MSVKDKVGSILVIAFTNILIAGVGIIALVGGLIIEHNPMALLFVGMSVGGLIVFWSELLEECRGSNHDNK